MQPKYLGDGVYLFSDDYHLILATDSCLEANPSNVIYLDPDVAKALRDSIDEYLNEK